jgi:hypothetical protein
VFDTTAGTPGGDMIDQPVRDDPLTLVCIGVVAGCLSSVAHEAIGHGGTCIAVGGRITLLTSVYFRCTGGGPITDAGGPLGNLALAAICWMLLQGKRSATPPLWLLLVLLMAFNGFWASGYFVYSGVLDTGDWAFAARDFFTAGMWQWRPIAVVLGVALYVATLRSVVLAMLAVATEGPNPSGRMKRLLRVPYIAAAMSACVAAAFFKGSSVAPAGAINAVREAAQEIGIASIGLWFAAGRYVAPPTPGTILAPIAHDRRWIVSGFIAFAASTASMGRGI